MTCVNYGDVPWIWQVHATFHLKGASSNFILSLLWSRITTWPFGMTAQPVTSGTFLSPVSLTFTSLREVICRPNNTVFNAYSASFSVPRLLSSVSISSNFLSNDKFIFKASFSKLPSLFSQSRKRFDTCASAANMICFRPSFFAFLSNFNVSYLSSYLNKQS